MNETEKVFFNVEQTLKTAEFGLNELQGDQPERKLAGLRNLAVFGRAVTNVLQKLRSIEPTFDKWYSKYVAEMKNDPLLKYFYKMRSEILKEGFLRTTSSLYIREFNSSTDMERIGIPPPNAKSVFMGDQIGGVGWIVELPDGTEEKYYGTLPSDIGKLTMFFPESPKKHLEENLGKETIDELGQLYFTYLKNMVDSAKQQFIKKKI